MIVSCPSCATRYLIDPTALGGEGRTVRCAKCSHTWHEQPPADMPKRVDILPPNGEPRPIPFGSNLPAIVARRRRANRLGWLAVALARQGARLRQREALLDADPNVFFLQDSPDRGLLEITALRLVRKDKREPWVLVGCVGGPPSLYSVA